MSELDVPTKIIMNYSCRICCNHQNNHIHQVKEMYFGFRDIFEYVECSNCKCLQIANIPDNMDKYYGPGYYSYYSLNTEDLKPFKPIAQQIIAQHSFKGNEFIQEILIPSGILSPSFDLMGSIPIDFDSHILDVGSGQGLLLYLLKESGFQHVQGIDPFIGEDIHHDNGLSILKKSLDDVEKTFDLIMFHHSFEHMEYPEKVLETVRNILKPDGVCLIRIPTCSSFAWQHYQTDWFSLDAPRHFYLFSNESMDLLFNKTGFNIIKKKYDATAPQFWASEQYQKDIPFLAENSYYRNPAQSIFTSENLLSFKARTSQLNREKQGDCVALLLQPTILSQNT